MPYRRQNNGLVGKVLWTAFGSAVAAGTVAAAVNAAIQGSLPEERMAGTEACEAIPTPSESEAKLKHVVIEPCKPGESFPTYEEYMASRAQKSASSPAASP